MRISKKTDKINASAQEPTTSVKVGEAAPSSAPVPRTKTSNSPTLMGYFVLGLAATALPRAGSQGAGRAARFSYGLQPDALPKNAHSMQQPTDLELQATIGRIGDLCPELGNRGGIRMGVARGALVGSGTGTAKPISMSAKALVGKASIARNRHSDELKKISSDATKKFRDSLPLPIDSPPLPVTAPIKVSTFNTRFDQGKSAVLTVDKLSADSEIVLLREIKGNTLNWVFRPIVTAHSGLS